MPEERTRVCWSFLTEEIPEFVEAFCETFNYDAFVEEQQREADKAGEEWTPPGRAQFAKAQVSRWIQEVHRGYKLQLSLEKTRNEEGAKPDIDVQEE